MKLYTAQYRYPGPHRLDITVKGNDPVGRVFAPTWEMVSRYKQDGNEEAYTTAYHKMMIDSYYDNHQEWREVLSRDTVVLVCFCPAGAFCHRLLLAGYLSKLGAKYNGEITDFNQPPPILAFQGKYRWLSNFWRVPFEYQGITYKSNEHFYQAWKANPAQRARIAACSNPKAEGRKIQLPYNWDQIKNEIMLTGLRLKFQNQELRDKLIATGNRELVEGNYWHDNYWGNCTCQKCANIPGQNMLGKLLMQVREEITKQPVYYYYHPESSCIWSSTTEETDALLAGVEEISYERYQELEKDPNINKGE